MIIDHEASHFKVLFHHLSLLCGSITQVLDTGTTCCRCCSDNLTSSLFVCFIPPINISIHVCSSCSGIRRITTERMIRRENSKRYTAAPPAVPQFLLMASSRRRLCVSCRRFTVAVDHVTGQFVPRLRISITESTADQLFH